MKVPWTISWRSMISIMHIHPLSSVYRMLSTWLGALAIFCVTVTATSGTPGIVAGLVTGAGFVVIYPALMRWAAHQQLRMMYSGGRNKGILGEHELEICDDGIIERTPYNETKTAWAAIERVENTPV
jgi:hypothetical protein